MSIFECEKHLLPNTNLCKGLAAAYLYDNPQDEQAVELQKYIKVNGIKKVIMKYSILDENKKKLIG